VGHLLISEDRETNVLFFSMSASSRLETQESKSPLCCLGGWFNQLSDILIPTEGPINT
jgi:hypothetical protein